MVALFASARVMPPLTTSHLSNTLPVGAAPAVRVTVVPIVALVIGVPAPTDAVPPVTVTLYSIAFQTAVTVVLAVTVILSPAAFSTPPTLQALNCLPAGAVKPFAGSVYSPEIPVTSAIVPVPPLAAKDTVYVTTGMFSQIAYTVLFSVISTLVTIAPSVVNDHPLNCFPLGAVNSFAGNVYSPVKSVTGVIVPLPPLASNVNVYLFSVHFA